MKEGTVTREKKGPNEKDTDFKIQIKIARERGRERSEERGVEREGVRD